MTLPLLLVAAAALWLMTSEKKPAAAPTTSGPAPEPKTEERPPANPGDRPPVRTLRCLLGTKDGRTTQSHIESLFTKAGVDGWYIGPENRNQNRAGRCIVELRSTSLEAAQLQMLNLDEVIYLEAIGTV